MNEIEQAIATAKSAFDNVRKEVDNLTAIADIVPGISRWANVLKTVVDEADNFVDTVKL